MRTRSLMTAGPVSQPAGEPQKQQVVSTCLHTESRYLWYLMTLCLGFSPFTSTNSCVCWVVDIDPDRLHHVGLTLVNQTACREKWGGGLISDSHICSHPAGSTACMVTPPWNWFTWTLLSVTWRYVQSLSKGQVGVKIYQLQKLPVMNLETNENVPLCFLHFRKQYFWLSTGVCLCRATLERRCCVGSVVCTSCLAWSHGAAGSVMQTNQPSSPEYPIIIHGSLRWLKTSECFC